MYIACGAKVISLENMRLLEVQELNGIVSVSISWLKVEEVETLIISREGITREQVVHILLNGLNENINVVYL